MKATQLITAVIAFAVAGSVFAQNVEIAAATSSVATGQQASTITREQVRAELVAARQNGELSLSALDYQVIPASVSSVSRGQVQAEVVVARKNGTLALSGLDYQTIPGRVNRVTREQVKAELVAARKNGDLPLSEYDYGMSQTKSYAAK